MHPMPFAVSVTGAAVFAGAAVLSTVVLGRVTDAVVLETYRRGDLPERALWWSVAAVMAVTVLRSVGVVSRRYFAAMTVERVQASLRYDLAGQYLALPMSWHQRVPAGQLLAHADNDVEVAASALNPLPFSLGVAFLALFSAISIIMVDPVLALIAFLVFPALTILHHRYSRRVEGPAAAVQAGVGRVSAVAHESFDGALVVKTLGRASAESERFSAVVGQLRADRVTVGFLRAMFEAVMDALPNLGVIAVLVVGIYRVEAGAVGPGDLVQVASLFTVLAFPLRIFGFFLESVPPSVVASERLATVLNEPRPATATVRLADGSGPLAVAARGVAFHYPEGPPVLHDIELAIAPGEVVALVGSTGSGKSTLCQVLCGLLPAGAGQVTLDGCDVVTLDPLDRTGAVALVFQEPFLFADTLRANIDVAGTASEAEVAEAARLAQIEDFVHGLPARFDTLVGERGVTLSGGQRQRVALARALIRSPRLLVLDDATSAVDARIERQILDGLRTGLEATTLIVAQRVSTIALADRVLYLREGRIEAAGTHGELLAHPGYASLVKAYELAAQ